MPAYKRSFFREVSREGPTELFALDASRTVLTLDFYNPDQPGAQMLATHKQRAVSDFLGYNSLLGTPGSTPVYISRAIPAALTGILTPDGFGGIYRYCTGFAWSETLEPKTAGTGFDGIDGLTGAAAGPRWRTKLQFETVPYQVLTDQQVTAQAGPLAASGRPDEGDALRRGWKFTRYVSKYVKPGGLFTTLKGGLLSYKSDGSRCPDNAFVKQTFASVTYVWRLVPLDGVPWKAIASNMGRVNDATFDAYQQATLLLDDLDLHLHRGPLGDWLADVQYMMKWLPNASGGGFGYTAGTQLGHNALLRLPAAGGAPDYDLVTNGAAGTSNYRFPLSSTGFDALFRPDQS